MTLEKVDPDGLLVLFAPVQGGSGSAKLKFRNLPLELREGPDALPVGDPLWLRQLVNQAEPLLVGRFGLAART